MAQRGLPRGVMNAREHEIHHLRTAAYLLAHAHDLGIDPSSLSFEVQEDPSGDRIRLTVFAPAGAFRRVFELLDGQSQPAS